MGLITETNQQYYQGAEIFVSAGTLPTPNEQTFTTTFDTDLAFGSYDPTDTAYALNNFKIYTSSTGLPNPASWTEYTSSYTVVDNAITLTGLLANTYIAVQLKSINGGNYGDTEAEKAYGNTVEDNYGGYEYIKLNDAIDNFMVGYVGDGKILQKANKSDVLFFAKRSLQEFSYDTLKSIHSQELTVPSSLAVVLPQDYVNYVSVCYIDGLGVKRPIYPANNLTISPYENPVQDALGIPVQDNFGETIEGTSLTEERWKTANDRLINGNFFTNLDEYTYWANYYGFDNTLAYGQLYGMDPQYSQVNGWFNPNY